MTLTTIDCGTTNSRVYIVNEQAEILGKAAQQIGVRDTAVQGTNAALKQALHDMVYQALDSAGLTLADVEFAMSSGMITSEIGLIDIPHLWAPAGPADLAQHLKKVHDTAIFPVDLPIYFVRGIKNPFDPAAIQYRDVGTLDFMRGEETQMAGILTLPEIALPVTVVVLSSHTKFISIDHRQRILGSLTTASGQIYGALRSESFISKSIRPDDDFDDADYFDEQIIDIASHWVRESGFLRALMMTRFLDVLLHSAWYERKLFVEAAIAAEDMGALQQFDALGFPLDTDVLLVGAPRRCRLYAHLLRARGRIREVRSLTDPDAIDRLSIQGALALARMANLL
jgi:2-dehydro-3-deoxygalactonokinase